MFMKIKWVIEYKRVGLPFDRLRAGTVASDKKRQNPEGERRAGRDPSLLLGMTVWVLLIEFLLITGSRKAVNAQDDSIGGLFRSLDRRGRVRRDPVAEDLAEDLCQRHSRCANVRGPGGAI